MAALLRHINCRNYYYYYPLWGHDAFPPCFRFPPTFDKFSDSMENFQNFTFCRKICRFSSAKISEDLFLVIDKKFQISPIFPLSVHSPFAKIIISPYFEIFFCFRKNHLLFTYFMCISFPPYFDHDAFMHHPMHVLGAPGHMFFLTRLNYKTI